MRAQSAPRRARPARPTQSAMARGTETSVPARRVDMLITSRLSWLVVERVRRLRPPRELTGDSHGFLFHADAQRVVGLPQRADSTGQLSTSHDCVTAMTIKVRR